LSNNTINKVIFQPGETAKTINVEIKNDILNEADETFIVRLIIPKNTPLNLSNTDILGGVAVGNITDFLTASSNTTLSNFVESLELTGTNNINGTGNTNNNVIRGNTGKNVLEGLEGNDTLEGNGGADTLRGGAGDDVYLADSIDTIQEEINGGNDTVQTNVNNYTLGTDLENLVQTGTGNITAKGNSLNNQIEGNTGNNVLEGLDGDDSLKGRNGADTLKGGKGDDTYTIDSLDTIEEKANEGEDTIEVNFTYTLNVPNVENVKLIGNKATNATGDSGNNYLIGNSENNYLSDNEGDDVLDGGGGIDTLQGGIGDDTYYIDLTEDIIVEIPKGGLADTVVTKVSYVLGDEIERLILQSGAGPINGTGNKLGNAITGNEWNNIINGGPGADQMVGLGGDDYYIVESIGDTIVEEGSTSGDTVESSIDYTLGLNLNNLILVGTAKNGTGNDQSNYITGNDQNNKLLGLGGADALDGGAGKDTLEGGALNDTYYVDQQEDVVIETLNNGIDLVITLNTYTLSANVEDLWLQGTDNFNGTGNTLNNKLFGNSGNNALTDGEGNDSLRGENGNDNLNSGNGNDTLDGGSGTDTLNSGDENDNLNGGNDNDTLNSGNGNDTLDGGGGIDKLTGGSGDDIYRVDNSEDKVIESINQGTDKVESSVNHTLLNNFENLTLTGGSPINGNGNKVNNVILGNNQSNTIDGKDGNDTLKGGSGNDVLVGGTGLDTLDGETGDDTLIGGKGNDIYLVNSALDKISEDETSGTDEAQSTATTYTLGDNVENLILLGNNTNIDGTGNSLNNLIQGSTGSNIIDGGAGKDTLQGGDGNDIYVIDNANDVVTETNTDVNQLDIVRTAINKYVLPDNVEILILEGTANLTGTGNELNNSLIGNSGENNLEGQNGKDTLDGGVGKDTLTGGDGDDSYLVDQTDDTITEAANKGKDTALASANYTLGNNVENLTLLGGNNLKGTGNTLNNLINGNIGNNTLEGKAGDDILTGNAGDDILVGNQANDTLIGGVGADKFNYNTGVAYSGADLGGDKINDFNSSEADQIILGKKTFALTSSAGNGFSNSSEFASVTTDNAGKASTARIVYSKETGNLFYNDNGTTVGGEAIITTLSNIPSSLAASDFIVEV